jgi:predicted glycoside hydrolase/deacetylase ChbG (UPF0249 family)
VDIVLNADDFGASPETVTATIDCFERGGLTSATIMPSMPAAASALAFARNGEGREISFGVHLTLVRDEASSPISDPSTIPTLVDDRGGFLSTTSFRALALLRRLPLTELEREISAQIGFVRDHGVQISHVDSHRHVHKLPLVQEALAQALPSFGIERVRTVQNVYLKRPLASPTVWLGPAWRRALVRRFRTTDNFYMPTSTRDLDWHGKLAAAASRMGGSSLEIGVHPGVDEPWRANERASVVAVANLLRDMRQNLVPWARI